MKIRILAAFAAVSILTACADGGSDGDGTSDVTPPVLAEAYATGWILVDTGTLAGVQRAQADCGDTVCTVSLPGGQSQEVDLEALKLRASAATTAAQNVEFRNGIRTARLRVEVDNLHFDSLGIWGDHNLASPGRGTATVLGMPLPFAIPVSIGQSAGTNPVSGSATWTGLMAGVKYDKASFGPEVLGDADMLVDFAAATLDLAFTNIVEQASEAPAADPIVWQDVPMKNGAFSTSDGHLEGNFYGPNHEEAGGAFDRDGIAGVFTIKRE